MDMARVLRQPKLLRTLTTLDAGEFERLHAAFEAAWQARGAAATTPESRVSGPWERVSRATLPTSRAQLFFVLCSAAAGGRTLQPTRKPRGRELYPWQKATNQLISKVRVGVEHAIGGVKRCRLVADTFRCWRKGLVAEVVLAASGL